MRKLMALVLALMLVASMGCMAQAEQKTLKIGFADRMFDGAWCMTEVEDVTHWMEEYGYELVITNASSDTEKQIADVEDLIAQNCDLIVIVPVDATAIAPAFEACKKAGIPVIDLDTEYLDGVWKEDYITVIRSDQYTQGTEVANWLMSKFESGEMKILEITGPTGQSAAQKRHGGLVDTLDAAGYDYEIISQPGNFSRATAQEVLQNVALSADGDFNVVYCHNDEMGLGALLGMKQAGIAPNADATIVAIDGQYEALDAVMANEIGAIITCNPRRGELLCSTIAAYFNGEELVDRYGDDVKVITPENVEELYDSCGF